MNLGKDLLDQKQRVFGPEALAKQLQVRATWVCDRGQIRDLTCRLRALPATVLLHPPYLRRAKLYPLHSASIRGPFMQPRKFDRESAQEGSAPANQTPEGRRGRRRKAKERREAEAGTEPEAGPSGVNTPTETSEKKQTEGKKRENAFEEADFIAFTFSDPEEDANERPPVREWDKGKGRASERDHAGRKRKSDEYDRDDGYTNKKQRVAAASRKAPWTTDVDWESCANVAEMYAS